LRAASRQERGWAEEEEGKGKGRGRGGRGKWRGQKGRAPSYCWTRAPQSLATPLSFKLIYFRYGHCGFFIIVKILLYYIIIC